MTRAANAIITGEGAHVFQLGTTQNPYFAGTGGLVEIDIDEFGGADSFLKLIWNPLRLMVKIMEYHGLLKQELCSTIPRC